ncbi:plasmid SOS inhibition protein A, partial [Escherichia coli]|uniref:plasmid SOS inhibition protein A n=2 Tax=Enterobacterales TaxID=91347 RepID=UPI003D33DB65
MSVTESKAKTERKSSRKPAKTQETVLSALLAQTEEVSVPLASLIKSPLNVRTVPYSAESVSELADSIKGVGLLQNLVVHALPGDRYGVAAGGRRLAALNMLAERDIIQADWPVRVKVIPQELATAASMTENGHRRDMHPAEQIAGFRAMAQEGKTPAQIGDLLGYSPRHVQRMLKLADLAPVILDALAEDRITTEHCQALALEHDTARQAQVPLSTEQQAAWRAVAETEKRRHQGNTLAEYPYAGAFFRCLNGSRRISLSDLRFFMPSLTAEELHGNRLQWLYAIDVLIETQGEACLLPLPGDAAERLFPSVRFRVRERSRHKSALVMQKYSRQQAREAEQKARAYQALVAQAEIELAYHSPETVGSWHARWSDRVAEHDLETLFW